MKITAFILLVLLTTKVLVAEKIIAESGNMKTIYDIGKIKDITFHVDSENNLIIEKRDGSQYLVDLSQVESFTITDVSNIDTNDEYRINSLNLLTSYPNPFNPETTVSFQLKKDGWTEIAIYNHIGQIVNKIHSGILKDGKYSFKWNASAASIPSGVYFVKVTHENEISTRKMLLIK